MELGLENRSPLRDAHSANRLPQFVQAVFVDRDGTMGGTGVSSIPGTSTCTFTREGLATYPKRRFPPVYPHQPVSHIREATETSIAVEDLKRTGPTFALDIDFPCNRK